MSVPAQAIPAQDIPAPAVSVLVTTYNRAALLPRAIRSVLEQDFRDFELIVIDDASRDETPDVMRTFSDSRIRHLRNAENQGAAHGDRAHVRRCIHELMRGKYFIYLCDDDYWLPKNLLSRQVAAFEKYPGLTMAVGAQAHNYPRPLPKLAANNGIVYEPVASISATTYHTRNAFPSGRIEGRRYLELLSDEPMARNMLDGATLFSREAMLKARAFASDDGARWQAGFEFKVGPALFGDVFYIDEPCVVAGTGAEVASYRGSQRQHYIDCLTSVNQAIANALPALPPKEREAALELKRRFVHQLTIGFLFNRITYKLGWQALNPFDQSGMYGENVTFSLAWRTLRANRAKLTAGNFCTLLLASTPSPVLRAMYTAVMACEATIGRLLPVRAWLWRGLKRMPGA